MITPNSKAPHNTITNQKYTTLVYSRMHLASTLLFAWFIFLILGAWRGGFLALYLFLPAVIPTPKRWQAFEYLTATIWVLSIAFVTSDIGTRDTLDMIFLFVPAGLFTGFSWLIRNIRLDGSYKGNTWFGLFFVPTTYIMAFYFFNSNLLFDIRLSLSAPSLRTQSQWLSNGFHQEFDKAKFTRGLFSLNAVMKKEDCTAWEANQGRGLTYEGLAYIPTKTPPAWHGFKFTHIKDNWWKYQQSYRSKVLLRLDGVVFKIDESDQSARGNSLESLRCHERETTH